MATNKPGQGAWGPSRTSLGCQSEPLAGPWAELSISSWNLTTLPTDPETVQIGLPSSP